MNLLPDINLGRHIISMQDPYTINGRLITYMEHCDESYVKFKIDNNQYYMFEKNSFRRYYERVYYSIQGMEFRDECDRYIVPYSFGVYLSDIECQCGTLFSSLITRLINQNRGDAYGEIQLTSSNEYYVRDSVDELGRISATDRGVLCDYSEPAYNTLEGRMFYLCGSPYTTSSNTERIVINDCSSVNFSGVDTCSSIAFGRTPLYATSAEPAQKYIHQYNYVPEYIKYYMDDPAALLLGAEIEVDCGGESEEHAKEVLKIMCGVDPEDPDKVLENKMYCTHDGSLRDGIEFDTMPCTLEYHKHCMNYEEMFKYLDDHGYKAHDTTTCGLHIHADRSYLGKIVLMQQLNISKILYILEKFNDEICVIARRNNSYSKFVGNGKNENSVIELYEKYKKQDKHVALNLKHTDSIEFRCFKGTLKYETFILTLEFVQDIIDFVKSINIEEIELITWQDVMDTFSDELKKYYEKRLKKSQEKVEQIIAHTGTNANASTLSMELSMSVFSATDIIFPHNEVAACVGNATTSPVNNGSDPVKQKKKEIKDLKQRLRHCNNYVERTRIQQSIQVAQRELKQLKRRN